MADSKTSWRTLVRRFVVLGLTGFGGPPAHVAQLRRQWVTSGALDANEFNDAFAAASLLPGPASTQTALWVGWRLRGWRGMVVAGLLFITPSVLLVTVLMSQYRGTGGAQPLIAALARGAATAVPAVAFWAAWPPLRASFAHTTPRDSVWWRRAVAALAGVVGGLGSAHVNPVVIILVAGCATLALHQPGQPAVALAATAKGLSLGLVGVALKVGALSFGGGFVIVAMMRADAVTTHHWLSNAAFAAAVAFGQITPGPVVATIAAVGEVVGGPWVALATAAVAFFPSFIFVGVGAPFFTRLRTSARVQAFFLGASSATFGLILASGVLLTRAFVAPWEWTAAAVALVLGVRLTPLWLLGGGAILGLVAHAVTG